MYHTASAFAAVLLWGTAPVALKLLAGALPGAALPTAIYTLVACITLPWLILALRQGGLTASAWCGLSVIGFMLTSAFNLLISLAAPSVRGTTIGAVVALEPLMIALIAAVLTRSWPARTVVMALLLSLAGVWLLVAPAGDAAQDARVDAPWAVALVIFGAALWSCAVVLAARLATPWSPLQTSMVMLCAGSLPFLLASPWLAAWPPAGWSIGIIGGLLFMVGVTVLANVLWLRALRALGPVATSLLINLIPLTTVGLSIAWLGESWSLRQLAGCALVVTAITFQPLLRAMRLRGSLTDNLL